MYLCNFHCSDLALQIYENDLTLPNFQPYFFIVLLKKHPHKPKQNNYKRVKLHYFEGALGWTIPLMGA